MTKPAYHDVIPESGMVIREDTRFRPGIYFVPGGIAIAADGVTLDGGGAVLYGSGREGRAVRIEGRKNVSVRDLRLRDYYHGIHARSCSHLSIEGNQITSTAEIPANSIFLDIWLQSDAAYGGAILLDNVEDSQVLGNDLQHQMNGLLTFGCRRLTVRGNNANHNSGFGIHLFETSDSVFEANFADYCCRYEPRHSNATGAGSTAGSSPASALPRPDVTASTAIGHVGADATGFLIVHGSCRNVFRSNYARLGGDGFFLAGLAPDMSKVPCDDNLFEGNDASLSPNIAFEATFSSGNTFRANRADRCNYGFWLGFSSRNTVVDNRIMWNRQAGVAVENGSEFVVHGNDFQRNGHGVLMWSKFVEQWFTSFPDNRTCHHWSIERNRFTRNDKGISIAADKDHGIRRMPDEACGRLEARPHDNSIRNNDIQENRVGVELHCCDRTVVEGNTLNRNVECNVRREDDLETILHANLGVAGGYL